MLGVNSTYNHETSISSNHTHYPLFFFDTRLHIIDIYWTYRNTCLFVFSSSSFPLLFSSRSGGWTAHYIHYFIIQPVGRYSIIMMMIPTPSSSFHDVSDFVLIISIDIDFALYSIWQQIVFYLNPNHYHQYKQQMKIIWKTYLKILIIIVLEIIEIQL